MGFFGRLQSLYRLRDRLRVFAHDFLQWWIQLYSSTLLPPAVCRWARGRFLGLDDGAIRPFIPDLIELGINILNPVQWRCRGMEREGLKRDFGDRLIFHGAIDNQQTMPFGSPDEVRRTIATSWVGAML